MKQKINFLLLFLSLTFTLSAGQWFTLTHLNLRPEGESWSGWQKLSPPIEAFLDGDRKRITIYSSKIQIFDYVYLEEVETMDGTVLMGWATDTDYKRVQIAITTLNDGQEFFTVIYQDVRYTYVVLK